MILGVISDTHRDRTNALPHIVAAFQKRQVEVIIHCGDIMPGHVKPELFGNLPVICALTDEQVRDKQPEFFTPPQGWTFTRPNERIVDLQDLRIYVGHKRSFEILYGSESKLYETLNTIRRDCDGVRLLFSGHTHHQIFMQHPLINFINPGAVEDAAGVCGGYEYALIDTEKETTIFSRIYSTVSVKQQLHIGVVSDSADIAQMDTAFWGKLAREFRQREVTHIIHCGNLALEDIGRAELEEFQVYYTLRSDQENSWEPENWHLIPCGEPVVVVKGYHFYVQYDLGATMPDKSEFDMNQLSRKVQSRYPETKYIFYGFARNGFYEEGENLVLLNPGNIIKDRNYAVIALPRNEITFGRITAEPLPPI